MKLQSENRIEKAILFATYAHQGKVRKGGKGIPQIAHPLAVAQILIEYGADENVIIAGILHDIAEDTPYTLEDIQKYFGTDVANLVEVDTETDKDLPWEKRKQQTIDKVKGKSLREKLVVMADKINNIEDIGRMIKEKGTRDFSEFKEGEERQEWYYRNIYESLKNGQNSENVLLQRLEKGINQVFQKELENKHTHIENER